MADRGMLAMLAATFGVLAIIVTVGLAWSSDNTRDPTLDAQQALERIRHLAGPGAVACGEVQLHADPRAAMACARQSAEAGHAFWVAKEGHGESLYWHGLVRSARGQFYLVTYLHDASGGAAKERRPALWTFHCRDPQLHAEGWSCTW